MSLALTFAKLYEYDTSDAGIDLPVSLRCGAFSVALRVKLDPGSTFCIFRRDIGEKLGFDIEQGARQWIGTATGRFLTYGHEAAIEVLGFETTATIYFAAEEHIVVNVLGRIGWLNRVRLGLVDYEGRLYLSDYNDPA